MALRPYRARGTHRASFLSGSALFALLNVVGAASAQTQLPEVVVSAPKQQPKPKPRTAQVRAAQPAAPVTPAAQLNAKADAFDQGRSNLYTTMIRKSFCLWRASGNPEAGLPCLARSRLLPHLAASQ